MDPMGYILLLSFIILHNLRLVSTLKKGRTEWLAARFAPGSSAPHAPEVSRYLTEITNISNGYSRHGRILDLI